MKSLFATFLILKTTPEYFPVILAAPYLVHTDTQFSQFSWTFCMNSFNHLNTSLPVIYEDNLEQHNKSSHNSDVLK